MRFLPISIRCQHETNTSPLFLRAELAGENLDDGHSFAIRRLHGVGARSSSGNRWIRTGGEELSLPAGNRTAPRFLCGGTAGPFILGPIYHYRAEQNGAPFHTGDRVEILVGANRGQVAQVAEVWEWRGDLRVDWGPSVARKGRTIFGLAQIIKVCDDEPPVAADASQAARR